MRLIDDNGECHFLDNRWLWPRKARWLPQTTYANCSGRSGDLPPPLPPAEKATARQDQGG
jgi:hypothetical protein